MSTAGLGSSGQLPPLWSSLSQQIDQGKLEDVSGIQQQAESAVTQALTSCANDSQRQSVLDLLLARATAEAQKAQAAASLADQQAMQAAAKLAQDQSTIANFPSEYKAAQQTTAQDQNTLNALTVTIAQLQASLPTLQSAYDTALANQQAADAALAEAQAAYDAANAKYTADVVANATVTQDEQQLSDLQSQITQLKNVTIPQLHQAVVVAYGNVQATQDSLTSAQNDLFYQETAYLNNSYTSYQATTLYFSHVGDNFSAITAIVNPEYGAPSLQAVVNNDETTLGSISGEGGQLPTANQNVTDALGLFAGALSSYNSVVDLQSQDPSAINAYTQAATDLDGQISTAQSALASLRNMLSTANTQMGQLDTSFINAQNTVIRDLEAFILSVPQNSPQQQQLQEAFNTLTADAQSFGSVSSLMETYQAAVTLQNTDSAIASAGIDSLSVLQATLTQLKALQADRSYEIQSVAAPKPLDEKVLTATSSIADQVKTAYANATSSFNILQAVSQNSTTISDADLQSYINQLQGMATDAQATVQQAIAQSTTDQEAVNTASQAITDAMDKYVADSRALYTAERAVVAASNGQIVANDQLQLDANALAAAADAAKSGYTQLIQTQTDYNSALHSLADLQTQRATLSINFTNAQPAASQAELDAATALQNAIAMYSGLLNTADAATTDANTAIQKLATDQDAVSNVLLIGSQTYAKNTTDSLLGLQTAANTGEEAYATLQASQNNVAMALGAFTTAQQGVTTAQNNIVQANADVVTKQAEANDLTATIAELKASLPTEEQMSADQAAMNAALATYNSAQTLAAQDATATAAAQKQLEDANNALTQDLAQETQLLAQVAADKAHETQLLNNYSAAQASLTADQRAATTTAATAKRLDKIAAAKQRVVTVLKAIISRGLMGFFEAGGKALPKAKRPPDTRMFI